MRIVFGALFTIISLVSFSQNGWWQGKLQREDGNIILINFEWKTEKGKPVWYIHNADEKIKVSDVTTKGDSLIVRMPVFESQFRLTHTPNTLTGVWIKGGAIRTQIINFTATPGDHRYKITKAMYKNIYGRWSAIFGSGNDADTAVAEFKQYGDRVTGTFMTTTGDYRYLEGGIIHDSLYISCFDGGHAFAFTGKINGNNITEGHFYSGARFSQGWIAGRDPKAIVRQDASAMYVRPGEEKLDFSFRDLNGKTVSINDDRFKNKVVVVQLMGSWCPNCMDETAFLSDYYNKNKQKGLEIISLAYEYSTDWDRSVKSLKKFQQRFNVQYPMLITGVAVTDSLRTEKTLPQLTPIRFFPSSVVIDRKGKIRKLDTSFNGPGTGEHYLAYKKEFEETISGLLREN